MFCSKTAIPAAVFQSLCEGGKLCREYNSSATPLHLSKRRAQPSNTQLIVSTCSARHPAASFVEWDYNHMKRMLFIVTHVWCVRCTVRFSLFLGSLTSQTLREFGANNLQ